ncbi:MAG: hypothetical protein GTO17_01475 [Candidatus Aminicenantes bacterium]|nr:hypothetical protein [Candidatus Aminicenantes bacterium]
MAALFKKEKKLSNPTKEPPTGKKWKAIAAVIILAVAIAYFLVLQGSKKTEEIVEQVEAFDEARENLTKVNMNTLQRAITSFIASQGRTPKSLKELQVFRVMAAEKYDSWGTEIKYERLSDDNFRLTSAGRDKTFDTQDDIVVDY